MKKPPKKSKQKKDTDFTDDKGGGAEPLTKEEFFRVLNRAINPPKPPASKKGKTSE